MNLYHLRRVAFLLYPISWQPCPFSVRMLCLCRRGRGGGGGEAKEGFFTSMNLYPLRRRRGGGGQGEVRRLSGRRAAPLLARNQLLVVNWRDGY